MVTYLLILGNFVRHHHVPVPQIERRLGGLVLDHLEAETIMHSCNLLTIAFWQAPSQELFSLHFIGSFGITETMDFRSIYVVVSILKRLT